MAAKKPRVAVVAIQDRGHHSLGDSALNARLLNLVKGSGFEATALQFQPAADVEHAAREAGCDYILYTDLVDVHHTTGTQVANTVSGSHKRDTWDAEVEFRLFAVDQVQALLSTTVTGKNAKSRPGKTGAAPSSSAPAATISVAEPDLLTENTPVEETGRERKHKSVAVASALEREVKMVRERINRPAAANAAQ
jgi:hypothetical protein